MQPKELDLEAQWANMGITAGSRQGNTNVNELPHSGEGSTANESKLRPLGLWFLSSSLQPQQESRASGRLHNNRASEAGRQSLHNPTSWSKVANPAWPCVCCCDFLSLWTTQNAAGGAGQETGAGSSPPKLQHHVNVSDAALSAGQDLQPGGPDAP